MGDLVEQEQVQVMGLTEGRPRCAVGSRHAGRPQRGESGVAFAAMVLAAVFVLGGLILLVAHWTSPRRPVSARVDTAALEKSRERIFVGRAGDLGIVLRSAGPGSAGKWKRDAEAHALALEPGQIVARMDAYNFSSEALTLVEGLLVVRMAGTEMRPIPFRGETDPASPHYAALAGGDASLPLGAHSARRIGLFGSAASFDTAETAEVRRGRIAEDVILVPRQVTERELADFDRSPKSAALDRWLAAPLAPEPLR